MNPCQERFLLFLHVAYSWKVTGTFFESLHCLFKQTYAKKLNKIFGTYYSWKQHVKRITRCFKNDPQQLGRSSMLLNGISICYCWKISFQFKTFWKQIIHPLTTYFLIKLSLYLQLQFMLPRIKCRELRRM